MTTSMQQPTMNEFYHSFSLEDYPFNLYTAENELSYLADLFVHPLNYDAIKSSFVGNRSIIIRGNRGTGKTALLLDLQNNTSKDSFSCVIDDYSDLTLSPTVREYYELILANITSTLFNKLFDEKDRLKKLNKDDKLLLSFLLSEYTNQVTQAELVRKIEAIQLPGWKRLLKGKADLIRAVCNYGLTLGLNIVNDVIRNYFSGLPPIQESQIRDIAPQFNLAVESEFNTNDASYKFLLRVCALVKKLGYDRISVFFDKFDEDSRMENNAEIISEFISHLLTDKKLLENPSIQIVVSVWEVPFSRLTSIVRTQKHYCPQLNWTIEKLSDALNRRISVFSHGEISNYRNMFSSNVDENCFNSIFELSNGNPRDLWHIFDHIFHSQYEIDPLSTKLSSEAVMNGLTNFVMNFNFYEYYPRKSNAKANTMDVYSYIKHLLKLSDKKFTKNQLNALAQTGSSTNNYVIGMENIGLIAKTSEKLNGGVLYQIKDPKVIYAIQNGLDISR